MNLQEKLKGFKDKKRAILAANFYNYETLAGILEAGAELEEPVILQLSERSIDYMGLGIAVKLARAGLEQFHVEGWLHLDHGSSLHIIAKCLEAGFDSVMIDASEKPFEDNIRITKQVVEMAAMTGSNVEAELGFVAKSGQKQDEKGFTSPQEALEFVERTGVNALAVAIGSAHGFYREEPRLDLGLLSRINEMSPVPLVLHGSSGIPDSMLREAIINGIVKVNLATESKNAFMQELRHILLNSDEIDLRKAFPPAIKAVKEAILHKMKLVSMK
jgi:fructose-bisphosphate aldolase class II/tagatose 1,6-diphosphate aldolase GatY/KbaY